MTVQESVEIVEQVALPPPNCTNASPLPPSLLLPNASSWLSSHTIIPARLPVASFWQNCVKPASSCHTPVLSLLPGFYFASSSSTTLSNHDGTWLSLLTLTFTMLAQLFDVGYFLHLAPSGELGCLTTPPQTSRKFVLSLASQQHCIIPLLITFMLLFPCTSSHQHTRQFLWRGGKNCKFGGCAGAPSTSFPGPTSASAESCATVEESRRI